MKMLVVDHNAVDPLSQSLYRAISEEGDIASPRHRAGSLV
jgi:hypothetical protein